MTVFGIGLDTGFNGAAVGFRDAGHLLAQARNADRDGLDVVTMTDHPYSPAQFDAYATLGFVLGATTRVTGVSTVTNLPCRPAPMLAKMAAGLSDLSGGRFALGVGAGVFWDEIVKLGVERRTPGEAVRLLEESITLVRLLTGGGDPVTFDGEFYRVADLPPSDAPTPPFWSGSIGPKSLAVTGRLADAWLPAAAQDWRSTLVATSRQVIDESAVDAGRDPSEIATVYNLFGRITDTPLASANAAAGSATGTSLDELVEASVRDPQGAVLTTRSADGTWIGGSVRQWVEELTIAVNEYGAGGFVFFPVADTIEEAEKARTTWAREIAPAVREAVYSTGSCVIS